MNILDFQRHACDGVRAELDSYLGGEPGARAREQVLEHLESCVPCADALHGRRRVCRLLQMAVGREAAPPALAARVRRLIRQG
ncbi:MAG: zf-HC2 domain-containing protein [Acidobacteriota bacterium]|nr:zf-HC2 domain-containing protein [Acidobacteriota bacterium]